jgi:DNA helicase II / ATP-dependent DNA helicase PcrA
MTTAHGAVRRALGGYEPTDEQAAAIHHPTEPLALIAGAGSGKTAVMAARIAHLVTSGAARPSQVLGLTFTNKAAQELDERIRLALSELDLPPGEEVAVFTYHGFADRLIRDYGPKIGIEPEVALLSPAQVYLLIERLFSEVTFETLRVTWLPSLVEKVRKLADACANHLVTPERVAAADAALARAYEEAGEVVPKDLVRVLAERPELCKVVRAYIDRKKELGRIDYGDQIGLAHRIVEERAEVAAALRERWPVVLLDEYQDTNVSQRKMMQAIYPAGSAVTVVGDPDQAIYAWRGATLFNILEFPEHFRSASGGRAEVKTLQRSFRSGRRILGAADAVIGRIPAERRGGDKVLEHHPATGEGEVRADLLASDGEEADLIAREIAAIAGDADGRIPYHEVAILCRKRRLFGKIERALRSAGIPVEVVGLGGLLMVPEVVDLLAYLQVIVTPGDNVAFARIAMGPRWRVGFRDLAALARWAAVNTGLFSDELSSREGEEVDPGEERFSLSEALGSVGEIEGLSDDARDRLRALGRELEELRTAVRGASLVEAVECVLARTGLEDELAATDSPVAAAARANLGSFLDFAGEFAPFEGDASIAAFLEFLGAAREGGEDLEVAQPQHENSVKLMTVHQAKGLEFDVVFVPGLAAEIFPDVKVTGNPVKAVHELPYSIREDARWLPEFDVGTKMNHFHAALKERTAEDERRLAYVALTRARRRLHVTCAHWYGIDYERKFPNGPGDYFHELAGRPKTDDDDATEPLDVVTVGELAECPDENPLRDELARRAASWPPADDAPSDELFPQGWRDAVESARAEPGVVESIVEGARVEPGRFEEERSEVAEQLELVTTPPAPPPPDDGLTSLSVSAIVQLARCPKQFYWTVVRPLPRRPSRHARLGQEVHRWIELRSIGQGRLDDPEEPVDLAPEEIADDEVHGARPGASLDDFKRSFESSRFAAIAPRYIEQPFAMSLGDGYLVRGRIDAVYVHPDGTWELVDYKTGREPDGSDATARLQLSIYALAAQRMWNVAPEKLRVTYFYLGTGNADPIEATDLETDEDALILLFEQVQAGVFDPHPGSLCRSCDFLRFCAAGRAHTTQTPGT